MTTTTLACGGALAGAVLLVWPARPDGRPRLHRVVAAQHRTDGAPSVRRDLRRPASGLAALGIAVFVGGWLGLMLAAASLVVLPRWLRSLESARDRVRRARRAAELPLLCDVLAACLNAGATPQLAVAAIADAGESALQTDLRRISRSLAAGASWDLAWRACDAQLSQVAGVMAASVRSGASAAPLLRSLATELRKDRRADRLDAARRLGVHTAAPLGLCFLPGFVLLGLVPIVAGLVVAL